MLDDVLLEIEPVDLTAGGLEALERLSGQPESAWYYRRRRAALAAAGLVGAYNPMQPRGHDGRWIEVFGWVRWLSGGNWQHGQVKSWSAQDGSALVKSSDGKNLVFSKQDISDNIYSLPSPKAKIEFPKGDEAKPGFTKIGGQDGSNPGGLYQVNDPNVVKVDSPVTPEMIQKALAYNGSPPDMDLMLPSDGDTASDVLAGINQNSLLVDTTTDRVYSTVGNAIWDLGTGEPIEPNELFGTPMSSRRAKILDGQIKLLRPLMDNHKIEPDEMLDIITTARSMAGTKPNSDAQFYVKTSKTPEHAKNEMLANFLYELGGVPVPETSLAPDGLTFGSKIVDGDVVVPLSSVMGTPEQEGVLDQLRENFVFDAWLANWDVAGMHFDNVKVVDGVPVRIDAGGSILYRATGPPKGKAWNSDVVELESLLNNPQNPTAPAVFKGITQTQINNGLERLAAISPQEIINAVEGHGLDKSLSDTLIARRKFILDKYNYDEPPVDADKIGTVVPESIKLPPEGTVTPAADLPPVWPNAPWSTVVPESAPPLTPALPGAQPAPKVYPDDISGMYWNADAGNFLPGEPPGEGANVAHVQWLEDNLPKDMTLQNIAYEYLHGKDIYVSDKPDSQNPGMWRVDSVTEVGTDKYTLDLVHAATGETWRTPNLSHSGTLKTRIVAPELTDDAENKYRHVFNDFRDHTANYYKTPGEVLAASNLGIVGMKTRSVFGVTDLKVDDWVVVPMAGDTQNPLAYKITKPVGASDLYLYGIDMDGNEQEIPKAWTMRRGYPGGVFDDTLDAIQARHIVAGTGDFNDTGKPSSVTQSNTPTAADVQMQKLSATEGYGNYGSAALPEPPPTPAAPIEPLTKIDWFDPDTQVNKNLTVLGEVIPLQDPDVDTDVLQALVGKKFYYRSHTAEGQIVSDGIYDLTKVEPISAANPQSGNRLTFTDMTGREYVQSTSPKYGYSSFSTSEMYQVSGNIAPISTFTVKKDNTIVVNGEVVGQWQPGTYTTASGYSYANGWDAVIHGKYTASGKDYNVHLYSKTDIKADVVPHILPPGAGGAKPKAAKVIELQKQITLQQIAFGAKGKEVSAEGNAVTMLDGAKVEMGMWVISKTDGKIGKIVATKVSPEAGVAGSVKVEYTEPSADGVKTFVKIRGASTLSAAINPDGELPPGSPLYAKVKLGDGSQPFPSQIVKDANGTPVVVMAIKPDGSMRVLAGDGTKKWVKSSSLSKHYDYGKTIQVEVDADPAGFVALSAPAHKAAAKPIKIPYSAPGGAVISQPSNAITEWRKYNPERKLTKDNFVPMVGMRVRDTKGAQFVVVRRANSYDADPSGVWVTEVGADKYAKPKKRSPNRLWVDHAAELSTWNGQPLPKVAKLHFNYSDTDSIIPDGSTIYSYSESFGYGAGRTKKISYISMTPDGKVYRIGPEGQFPMSEWEVANGYFWSTLGKIAYVDSGSNATVTVESDSSGPSPKISKLWVHDSTPGALEDLKISTAQADAAEVATQTVVTPPTPTPPTPTPTPTPPTPTVTPPTPTPTPSTPPAAPTSTEPTAPEGVYPDIFNGDEAGLTPLPKPTDAVGQVTGASTGPPPPQPQSNPAGLAVPSTVAGSFSIGSGIDELINKRIPSGEIASRTLYTTGDSDYIEDQAIRLQSVVNSKTGEEMIEVRFRLLEDKIDDLGLRLISNKGKTKVGGWDKTPLKTPKDIVIGDAISVKISTVTPPVSPDHPTAGGALKPDVRDAPNVRVTSSPVLVGKTPGGFDAYRIEVVVAGGASGSIIVENRPTPSVPTYVWNPDKVIAASYFDSEVNPDATAMGWTIRNASSSGYEVAKSITSPDEKGRKILEPDGVSVFSTGSNQGSYRLKYDAGEGSYMSVQVTHPASEERAPNIWHDSSHAPPGATFSSRGIRQSANGEVLIRVPANDPNALAKVSEMMSAAGVPPAAQGQPSGRDLRKMALNKVFKQFNSTYTHMQRPDITGDDDASAAAVLALVDKEVKGHMPDDRKVTMDDIHLRVTPHGRVEVIFSDDVARALTEKGKFVVAYHRLKHGYDEKMFTSKAEVGLLSTDERYSAGIIKNGMSSESDVGNDAGNRLYFRLAKPGQSQQGHIVVSALAINKKLDNYWSPSDYFGRREPENVAHQYLTSKSFGEGSNEIKIKRMIDPEMMAFIVVSDPESKIASLKKKGVTHIWGRPIEEIVISEYQYSDSNVGELGAHYGTEIPITAIPLDPPIVPTAPLIVMSGGMPYINTTGGTMSGTIALNTTSDPRLS